MALPCDSFTVILCLFHFCFYISNVSAKIKPTHLWVTAASYLFYTCMSHFWHCSACSYAVLYLCVPYAIQTTEAKLLNLFSSLWLNFILVLHVFLVRVFSPPRSFPMTHLCCRATPGWTSSWSLPWAGLPPGSEWADPGTSPCPPPSPPDGWATAPTSSRPCPAPRSPGSCARSGWCARAGWSRRRPCSYCGGPGKSPTARLLSPGRSAWHWLWRVWNCRWFRTEGTPVLRERDA